MDEDDLQTQKNSSSNWSLIDKLFPIGHERWKRLRRLLDGYRVSCTTGKWKKPKNISDILLARYKGKSFLLRIVTGNEEWIFYENSKSKKSWVDPDAPSTSTQDRIALTERRYSVFGGIIRAWYNMSC